MKKMYMNNYSKNEIILVKFPFSDLSFSKIRPAVVINTKYPSFDIIIVPLTSKINNLLPYEFTLTNWIESGLNAPSAVKRGIFTINDKLVVSCQGYINRQECLFYPFQ